MELYIYTDGASRGNPGKSASGYAIFNKSHTLLDARESYNGIKTNNFAEYYAVIMALTAANVFGPESEIELRSDSRLIVSQLNGIFKVKDMQLKKLHENAISLARSFKKCVFINVPRENKYITEVDKALNNLLDKLEDT
jgi:ribonuclease HI